MGGQGESSRSVFTIARGTTVLETRIATQQALQVKRENNNRERHDSDDKKVQVQGKEKVRQTILEIQKQHAQLHEIKKKLGDDKYNQKRKFVWNQLTNKEQLFKTARIEKKVQKFKDNINRPHVPTQAETRQGCFITPLLLGKHQYGKIKKEDNMKVVREELKARQGAFGKSDGWMKLLTLLKAHEGDNKYFSPVTDYDNFVSSDMQQTDKEVSKIQYSLLKKSENLAPMRDELRAREVHFDESTSWKDLLTSLKEDEGDNKFFRNIVPVEQFVISTPCVRAPSSAPRQQEQTPTLSNPSPRTTKASS